MPQSGLTENLPHHVRSYSSQATEVVLQYACHEGLTALKPQKWSYSTHAMKDLQLSSHMIMVLQYARHKGLTANTPHDNGLTVCMP